MEKNAYNNQSERIKREYYGKLKMPYFLLRIGSSLACIYKVLDALWTIQNGTENVDA